MAYIMNEADTDHVSRHFGPERRKAADPASQINALRFVCSVLMGVVLLLGMLGLSLIDKVSDTLETHLQVHHSGTCK